MSFVQIMVSQIELPSGRVDDASNEMRKIITQLHFCRARLTKGGTVSSLFNYATQRLSHPSREMSAMDRADLTHLLHELGWRRRIPKRGGEAKWFPPKGSAKKKHKTRRRQLSRSR